MKGTLCGKRAISLVLSLAILAAIAPAIARADVLGGVASAVPSTPTAPAVPVPAVAPAAPVSVPAPATPSVQAAPAPVATATKAAAPVAGVVASVAKPAASAKATAVAKVKAAVSKPRAAVKVRVATPVAKVSAKAVVAKPAASASVKASASDVIYGKSSMTIKLHPQSVVFKAKAKAKSTWRKLVWSGDDPNGGCNNGTYQTCTSNTPFDVDNRCYPAGTGNSSGTTSDPTAVPDGANASPDLVHFTQGRQTIWMKTSTDTSGIRIHIRQFNIGFFGVGTLDGATYKLGKDVQHEWDFLLPLGDLVKQDQRTWDTLIVDKSQATTSYTGLPPSMEYQQHLVATPTSISISWHLVCKKGDKPDSDQGQDHDRSGDLNKYKHHSEDYHGYNDDPPSSWDQGDDD
jgi:hypothetical protein